MLIHSAILVVVLGCLVRTWIHKSGGNKKWLAREDRVARVIDPVPLASPLLLDRQAFLNPNPNCQII